mgnify:CR=1 FL=1
MRSSIAGEEAGHVAVLDQHALGRAGRARGVDHVGQVGSQAAPAARLALPRTRVGRSASRRSDLRARSGRRLATVCRVTITATSASSSRKARRSRRMGGIERHVRAAGLERAEHRDDQRRSSARGRSRPAVRRARPAARARRPAGRRAHPARRRSRRSSAAHRERWPRACARPVPRTARARRPRVDEAAPCGSTRALTIAAPRRETIACAASGRSGSRPGWRAAAREARPGAMRAFARETRSASYTNRHARHRTDGVARPRASTVRASVDSGSEKTSQRSTATGKSGSVRCCRARSSGWRAIRSPQPRSRARASISSAATRSSERRRGFPRGRRRSRTGSREAIQVWSSISRVDRQIPVAEVEADAARESREVGAERGREQVRERTIRETQRELRRQRDLEHARRSTFVPSAARAMPESGARSDRSPTGAAPSGARRRLMRRSRSVKRPMRFGARARPARRPEPDRALARLARDPARCRGGRRSRAGTSEPLPVATSTSPASSASTVPGGEATRPRRVARMRSRARDEHARRARWILATPDRVGVAAEVRARTSASSLVRRTRPVDRAGRGRTAMAFVEAAPPRVLRQRSRAIPRPARDQLAERVDRGLEALRVEAEGRLVRGELEEPLLQDRARVELGRHDVPGDAVARLAVDEGPGRRVQTGVLGQRTVVEVDRAPHRQTQDTLRARARGA